MREMDEQKIEMEKQLRDELSITMRQFEEKQKLESLKLFGK